MLRVIVRRSTLTIRSTIGIRKTTPGPFGSSRRPSRKTTPRSYSRRMRMKSMVVLSGVGGCLLRCVCGQLDGCDGQLEPVQCVHLDVLAGEQLRSVARVRSPELAVDEDEAAPAHLAVHADEGLRPRANGPSSCSDSLAGDERPEG